ncbi:DUF6879 family protein [Thermomonospora sp. CIF 1]|uniref:DUF6879 family protein n=1 Tax=Thermomonospora sp. CIF 1 TaxID=1916083 RepID=UPI000AF88473|nr:DUF6879 family protein [Thermomonospora sp. CIF 1]
MHQPPAWILQDAHRLTLEEFQQAFGEAWSRLKRRFLKVECWQSYREADGVRSQKAYQEGKAELARELLREEAKGDQPLYEEVNARNLEFTRIRLISLPLTDYLRYEMINYEIRRALGENIEFVTPPTPVTDYFDFLLFDDHTALIHDYGPGPVGHQVGGWVTRAAEPLKHLEKLACELRTYARPWPNVGEKGLPGRKTVDIAAQSRR